MSNDLEERLRQYRLVLDDAFEGADRATEGSGAISELDGHGPVRARAGRAASGRAVAAALAIAVIAAGAFSIQALTRRRDTRVAAGLTEGTSTSEAVSPNAPLSVRLVLDQNVVKAGMTIHGVVEIINQTGQAVTARVCDLDPWPTVYLTSSTLQYQLPTSGVLCGGAATIGPGVTRQPVTISTTYPACTYPNRGFPATVSMPFCVGTADPPSQLPPLPPGHYTTTIVMPPMSHQIELPSPTDVTIE